MSFRRSWRQSALEAHRPLDVVPMLVRRCKDKGARARVPSSLSDQRSIMSRMMRLKGKPSSHRITGIDFSPFIGSLEGCCPLPTRLVPTFIPEHATFRRRETCSEGAG